MSPAAFSVPSSDLHIITVYCSDVEVSRKEEPWKLIHLEVLVSLRTLDHRDVLVGIYLLVLQVTWLLIINFHDRVTRREVTGSTTGRRCHFLYVA